MIITEHILSLSYGKDSIACIEAVKQLGYPLDRIVHAEVWATDTISADLPPMVEFKEYADKKIKERYGIDVEHYYAMRNGEKLTYEKLFYHIPNRKKDISAFQRIGSGCCANSQLKIAAIRQITKELSGLPMGFPMRKGSWCTSKLKSDVKFEKKIILQYLGIACDEPKRIQKHIDKPNIKLPLVDIGWTEQYCRDWCEQNELLSPIYTTATRGGCWFCHNQGTEQLRLLRKNYPDLWQLLLKWDSDSPVSFKADGHTVHDYDERFACEERGTVAVDRTFRWDTVFNEQLTVWNMETY